MLACPGVQQSAVIARLGPDGLKYLLGYYVGPNVPLSTLKNYLRQQLPSYLIPSALVQLERLPVTINGKLDRRVLPEPNFEQTAAEYQPAQTPTEKQLAAIWQTLLGQERIGIDAPFFEIGGNSLLLIQLHALIKNAFEVPLEVIELFHYPTIRTLAQYLENAARPAELLGNPLEYRTSEPLQRAAPRQRQETQRQRRQEHRQRLQAKARPEVGPNPAQHEEGNV
jgi:acyl carrier protein